MIFSRWFVRLNWLALVLIFLVILAGSLVRITGSGMGCPDWPKCFGEWVPPTDVSQIPENYKDIYAEKRGNKIEKFAKFLRVLGMSKTASQLENDPELLIEQSFNVRKTWTEYANRLVGFLSGNALLLIFAWVLLRYRKNKRLLFFVTLNLFILVVQAWFGSIVVASNLVPWTITVHMLLALVIVGLQLYIIYMISPKMHNTMQLNRSSKFLAWIIFIISVYQMFLGTQVREEIDALIKLGYNQGEWLNTIGMSYYIHRSFSWLVLGLVLFLAYQNEKNQKYPIIRVIASILILELISGVTLAHLEMPAISRTIHLLLACLLFAYLFILLLRQSKWGSKALA